MENDLTGLTRTSTVSMDRVHTNRVACASTEGQERGDLRRAPVREKDLALHDAGWLSSSIT
jgi:hypothetical protein